MYIIIEKFPPTDEEHIVAVEKELSYTLPEQYRQFLLKHNGGRAQDRIFDIPNEGQDQVRYFYGINLDEIYDLMEIYRVYIGRIPDYLLPIGEDSFGNLICISLSPDNRGKIYFWDHEKEFISDESTILLADSFDEFINKLREEP